MVAIIKTTFFLYIHFLCVKIVIFWLYSLKFVLKAPINKMPLLGQIMACPWADDKPLSKLMIALFTEEYVSLII